MPRRKARCRQLGQAAHPNRTAPPQARELPVCAHAKSHLERRHQLRARARAGGAVPGVHGNRHRLRLAGQAQHGPGGLQAHQQAHRQGNRQRTRGARCEGGRRQLRGAGRRRDQGGLPEDGADHRNRMFRAAHADSLHAAGKAVLPGTAAQGREGLRAAARGLAQRWRGGHCARGDAHQGTPGRPGAGGRGADAGHAALGRRGAALERAEAACRGCSRREPERRRAEDGRAADCRHDRRLGRRPLDRPLQRRGARPGGAARCGRRHGRGAAAGSR